MNRSQYKGFQPHIRAGISGWDALLFVYGILFIPVFLLVLLGMDLLVWAHIRVNYVFIFGPYLSSLPDWLLTLAQN